MRRKERKASDTGEGLRKVEQGSNEKEGELCRARGAGGKGGLGGLTVCNDGEKGKGKRGGMKVK